MTVYQRLNEEVISELEKLKDMEVGSEQYRTTVDGITKLVDRINEYDKLDADVAEKHNALERELAFKREQMEEEKKDRWIKNGIAIGGILIPAFLAVWGTKSSFEFEKEGTITTIMGRGWVNKLLPKK